MELSGKAAMNFNESAAVPKLLSPLNRSSCCRKLSFYIIGEMFRTNELFVDSVVSQLYCDRYIQLLRIYLIF